MSEDDRPHTYEESPSTGGGSARVTTDGRPPVRAADPPAPPVRSNGEQSAQPNGEYPAYDHYSAQPVYRPPENGTRPRYEPPMAEPRTYGDRPGVQPEVAPERTDRARAARAARAARPPRPPRPPRTPRRRRGGDGDRPRVKKLRLLIVLIPLGLLAIVSAFFGAVMSITSDLKSLEKSYIQADGTTNSKLLALDGEQLGLLTDNTNRVLVTGAQIPREMKWAIVSVEDKRFYTNSGVDLKGIARALLADVLHQQAQQGASTITQQFVKNALAAQGKRTIFEKVREAALAYHLTRQWSKDKILTEYLNSIYFGNGAYGIESAARTYFGNDPTSSNFNCGTTGHPLCVQSALNDPANAALIAGIVASPTAFDPVTHPGAATGRRNLVLEDMYQQGYISYSQYQAALTEALPAARYVEPPQPKVKEPGAAYFTTWVRQQVIDRYGPEKAFDGGLTIHTTLDLQLQQAAEAAVNDYLPSPTGPSAAVVAIDNATGEVRAMYGGRDYNTTPFNLATQGQRQPGSAFKPFVLAQALKEGISPNSVWPSEKRTFTVRSKHGVSKFVVNNDDATYAGTRTLAAATTYSDNSVFAAVGIKAGTKKIAKVARAAGIRTPISTNDAMTIGGLTTGVTAIDLAHAYETLAEGGKRISGSLGTDRAGPVGISSVAIPGQPTQTNVTRVKQVIPASVVATEDPILHTVLTQGTGTAAQFGVYAAGKTGTTSNYVDAWFVAFTSKLTVAVWVGYPDRLEAMTTSFEGGPVLGGTFPALIWRDFMVRAYNIFNTRAAQAAARDGRGTTAQTSTTDTTPFTTDTQPTDTVPNNGGTNGAATGNANPTGTTDPNSTGTADQTGAGNGAANGTGAATGTGTPNPTAPTDGTGAGTPATPTPGTATPTPPASTPSPGASGGASAPTG